MEKLVSYIEEERRNIKGKLRIVRLDWGWLTEGEVIQLMDVNISEMKVMSLNTGNFGWFPRLEVEALSDPIEGGV